MAESWASVKPKSDVEVAEAARAWGRLRLLVLAVKDARNGCRCECEEGDDYETNAPGVPPCWKGAEWERDGEPTHPEDWCGPCLVRQKWHLALVAIKRVHGGRLRRLQRLSASSRLPVPQEHTQEENMKM